MLPSFTSTPRLLVLVLAFACSACEVAATSPTVGGDRYALAATDGSVSDAGDAGAADTGADGTATGSNATGSNATDGLTATDIGEALGALSDCQRCVGQAYAPPAAPRIIISGELPHPFLERFWIRATIQVFGDGRITLSLFGGTTEWQGPDCLVPDEGPERSYDLGRFADQREFRKAAALTVARYLLLAPLHACTPKN